MCREYSYHVHKSPSIPIIIQNETVQDKKKFNDAVPYYAIGGVNAKRKEFPHMVIINIPETEYL